jgi:hypothetical protein
MVALLAVAWTNDCPGDPFIQRQEVIDDTQCFICTEEKGGDDADIIAAAPLSALGLWRKQ